MNNFADEEKEFLYQLKLARIDLKGAVCAAGILKQFDCSKFGCERCRKLAKRYLDGAIIKVRKQI
jgi:hypothetical protein